MEEIMNWKKQCEEYERSFGVHAEIDWEPVISFAGKVIENNSDDIDAYIRSIYLLHNIFLFSESTTIFS